MKPYHSLGPPLISLFVAETSTTNSFHLTKKHRNVTYLTDGTSGVTVGRGIPALALPSSTCLPEAHWEGESPMSEADLLVSLAFPFPAPDIRISTIPFPSPFPTCPSCSSAGSLSLPNSSASPPSHPSPQARARASPPSPLHPGPFRQWHGAENRATPPSAPDVGRQAWGPNPPDRRGL